MNSILAETSYRDFDEKRLKGLSNYVNKNLMNFASMCILA